MCPSPAALASWGLIGEMDVEKSRDQGTSSSGTCSDGKAPGVRRLCHTALVLAREAEEHLPETFCSSWDLKAAWKNGRQATQGFGPGCGWFAF